MTQRSQEVSDAYQVALTMIEKDATRQPFDLDVDVEELTLIFRAMTHISSVLVRSAKQPVDATIAQLRMLALEHTTDKS